MAITKQSVDLRISLRSGAIDEGLGRSDHEIQVRGALLSAATNIICRTPMDHNRWAAFERHMVYSWDFSPGVPNGTTYAVPA
jgi:hypothetical protein